MEETKRLLVENSHLPMSIILVGVGKGDMTKMDILDDDRRTMSYNGKKAERDIVQFVGKDRSKTTILLRLLNLIIWSQLLSKSRLLNFF